MQSSAPRLGPAGYGALKLSLTKTRAQATGVITAFGKAVALGCPLEAHLKGNPGSTGGRVFYSDDLGVEVIQAYPGIRTPQGIGLGSTTAAVTEIMLQDDNQDCYG